MEAWKLRDEPVLVAYVSLDASRPCTGMIASVSLGNLRSGFVLGGVVNAECRVDDLGSGKMTSPLRL